MDDPEKLYSISSILLQALCIISNPSVNSNWSYSPETLSAGQNWRFFVPCDLEIWWMTSKNNRALFNATASFLHHSIATDEFKLELQSGNALFGSKSTIFFSRVTSQFDVWPWKTIGHLFYASSSFVHHSVAIGEFKLELQSGNAQFGSKSTIFRAVWPWNLMFDLEKQWGTSPKQHQAVCIISSQYVNSN